MERAWRFVHPDLDEEEGVGGLQFAPQGGAAMVSGRRSVRQALLLLLSTMPGERVMRPEYGCYIHRLIFAPNDDTTAGLAIHYVQQAVKRWEPRIDLISVTGTRHPDAADHLILNLSYRIKESKELDTIQISLNLAGGTVA